MTFTSHQPQFVSRKNVVLAMVVDPIAAISAVVYAHSALPRADFNSFVQPEDYEGQTAKCTSSICFWMENKQRKEGP